MPRRMTQDERFMKWAREVESLYLPLLHAPIPEQVRAYKQVEKRILKETRSAYERLAMQRRITEALLMATMEGPWRGFSPYLRRMERLGYSSVDSRMLVCSWAARACKGSPAGRRKTAALIADFERRVRGRKLHPAYREQIDIALTRARRFAGLGTGKEDSEGGQRLEKQGAHKRRSAR